MMRVAYARRYARGARSGAAQRVIVGSASRYAALARA